MTKNFKPQANRPETEKKRRSKSLFPTIFLSGLFVAVSFLVMLIPLALFNIAQVSALFGKKTACLLMLAVGGLLFVLGFLLSSFLFTSSSFFVILSIPFFIYSVALRQKSRSWLKAAGILLLPVIVGFGVLCFAPPTLTPTQYNQMIANIEQTLTEKKQEIEKSLNSNAGNSAAQYDHYISQFREASANAPLRDFLGYSGWQRIAYFVFGSGASIFLLLLVLSIANIIFLDFGFEQVEQLKAIALYVKKNQTSFPAPLVSALLGLRVIHSSSFKTPLFITSHRSLVEEPPAFAAEKGRAKHTGFLTGLLSSFSKPLQPEGYIYWQGFSFTYEGAHPWRLSRFTLPLSSVLLAILMIAGVSFWTNGFDQIISVFHGSFAPLLGLLSFISFSILTLVALQGMITLYRRLRTFVIFFLALIFLVVGSELSFGAYLVLAIFGAIGLLDYVYDWRGLRRISSVL